jgi:hypothetical protein
VIATGEDGDAVASAWAWSRGDTAIPPLARYLLHAAKLRYQLRVWLRDDRARELREGITETAAEARRTPDVPRQAELLRRRDDALLMADELRDLRRTVEIAADNMARALGDEVEVSGPFADDRDLAQWFLARLDDDSAYLDTATRRAQRLTARRVRPPAGPERPAGRAPADGATPDTSRNVFVVHGRDEQARVQMFEFLRALDLRPLEWESLVAGTGGASPFLGNVVAGALTRAQTALVLLTPDDVVRLHPELHAPNEDPWETRFTMQARPNVLLELGMALAAYGDRTVMVIAGDHRPVADYGGRNFIRLDDSPACRQKIARRLRLAGCPVDDGGQDWLAAGRFADLTAYRRRPDPQG